MRLGAILTVIGGLAIASLRWGGVSEAKGQSQSQAQSQATSAQSSPPRPRERQYKDTVFFPPQADLSWPLTGPTQNYASINGAHLTEYVKDLIDISERYHQQGHQFWGRITGTDADAETARWMTAQLRRIGVTDVHTQDLDLPPQWMPKSWEVTASGDNRAVKLETAQPMVRTPGTSSGATIDLEAIYVGLGTEADFIGRDVHGKAAFIESIGLPGAWQHSATVYDAAKRAQEHGAAAIFIVINIPGNFRSEVAAATSVPTFTLGWQDGTAVREMIEQSPGKAPHVKIRSDIGMASGEKTSIVWGVIPGMTDEKIIINAHRDGYFDAADDNGTGVATALGLAEYFVKIPKEQRRRTIVIVGNSGHHNTPVSSQWIVAHHDTFLANAALIINCEHTSQVAVDLYGYKLVATNVPWNFDWFVSGSPEWQSTVKKDWDTFGVARYAEPTEHPNGDIGSFYQYAPALQLIQATIYYHTDKDTLQTISPAGLAAVTRAYAKIIDDANHLDLKGIAGHALPEGAKR
jgi:Peptidase family M28